MFFLNSFVGTFKSKSMTFVPTKYLKYHQNIAEIVVSQCENAKIFEARSLRSLALYIDFNNVSLGSV